MSFDLTLWQEILSRPEQIQMRIYFRTDFMVLNLYCIKGALALFVLVSFSGYVC